VEIYGRVRRAVFEWKARVSVRWRREFGIVTRDGTQDAAVFGAAGLPAGQRPVKRPKLGPWIGMIDTILRRRQEQPREATAYGEADLRPAYGRSTPTEVFVPLTHAPGEAQVDFGEALVVIAGVEQKAHYLAMDLASLGRLLCGCVSG
jgi:phage baseplate assembly protein W